MSFKTETLEPSNNHSETILSDITQFLFTHLGKYGDPANDIRKAINYALSTEQGKGGRVLAMRDEAKDNQLIGAVVLNETEMEDYMPENILVYIAVHEGYRGAGIGKKLVETALKMVNGSVALHVEHDNPAKRLYERLGFTNKYLEMRWQASN
ncbi:GNAT family N-acetyltransferase [Microscilla marina]|uniref:Acetyltransferase, gnat family n=1 Tax=Microscilla marina ATCC 23134 TaxID=313606 RepID=A1ZXV0_MICM2|nr:GNAT family N-acetyltransferase [Microscilla marina]EAY24779.1 acetyltransferase, gnat family [Microscilla marina ATCC 23134]